MYSWLEAGGGVPGRVLDFGAVLPALLWWWRLWAGVLGSRCSTGDLGMVPQPWRGFWRHRGGVSGSNVRTSELGLERSQKQIFIAGLRAINRALWTELIQPGGWSQGQAGRRHLGPGWQSQVRASGRLFHGLRDPTDAKSGGHMSVPAYPPYICFFKAVPAHFCCYLDGGSGYILI